MFCNFACVSFSCLMSKYGLEKDESGCRVDSIILLVKEGGAAPHHRHLLFHESFLLQFLCYIRFQSSQQYIAIKTRVKILVFFIMGHGISMLSCDMFNTRVSFLQRPSWCWCFKTSVSLVYDHFILKMASYYLGFRMHHRYCRHIRVKSKMVNSI